MLNKIDENCGDLLEIFVGMSQVTRYCRQDIAFCEGVTFHQFMILDAVAKKKELSMADLHVILSVEKSTTTRLVTPLIQKGLLRRDRAENDLRAVKLVLTSEGKNIHKKVWVCLLSFFNKVSRNIPKNQKDNVLKSIHIFINAIKEAAAEYSCCK
jgi:DNA-binding MarR family transcriptional regulator